MTERPVGCVAVLFMLMWTPGCFDSTTTNNDAAPVVQDGGTDAIQSDATSPERDRLLEAMSASQAASDRACSACDRRVDIEPYSESQIECALAVVVDAGEFEELIEFYAQMLESAIVYARCIESGDCSMAAQDECARSWFPIAPPRSWPDANRMCFR